MRSVLILLGVILVGAGVAIWFGRFRYPDEHQVIQVAALKATLTRERPIPQWLGAVTALTGVAIALLGAKYR